MGTNNGTQHLSTLSGHTHVTCVFPGKQRYSQPPLLIAHSVAAKKKIYSKEREKKDLKT